VAGVLLPLAMHPIYECTKNSEAGYALEAVATVGAISRHLPFHKWSAVLQKVIVQVKRNKHDEQERFLIGTICAVMDGFHFDVAVAVPVDAGAAEDPPDNDEQEEGKKETDPADAAAFPEPAGGAPGNTVLRTLGRRILPAVESLLMKDAGPKSKSRALRAPVALALLGLFRRLPPAETDARLPGLLLKVCGALRSRESDHRDRARETLAKMAVALGDGRLKELLTGLGHVLREGYMLHVRAHTLHTVAGALWQARSTEGGDGDAAAAGGDDGATEPAFDTALPTVMDFVLQDLFGVAAEMRETKDVNRRVIREAVGTRSYETLEIVSRMLLFRPSAPKPSVDVVVGPLLQKLRAPDVGSADVRKVRECLDRVAAGLSRNGSVRATDCLRFVHDTIAPFLASDPNFAPDGDGGSDSEEELTPIEVTRTSSTSKKKREDAGKAAPQIAVWLPSLHEVHDKKSAAETKKRRAAELHKVLDGASAPKLTGRSRHGAASAKRAGLSDPSVACGVAFGLSLLHSLLKKSKLDWNDSEICEIADRFVPVLTACVGNCRQNDIILLSLRCLGYFLRWDLPSIPANARLLGTAALKLLTGSGGATSTRQEITQCCFKALTLLMSYDRKTEGTATQKAGGTGTVGGAAPDPVGRGSALVLTDGQMDVLVSLLQSSVTDSDHHNATFGLVREILTTKFLSPGLYDMMDQVLCLTVQSQKDSVRQLSRQIFVQFIVDYPLEKKKLEQLLKRVVENAQYEHEDGRHSAIVLAAAVVKKMPPPLLREYVPMFFLPLVLRLATDVSKKCRDAVADTIGEVFARAGAGEVAGLYDYMGLWFTNEGAQAAALRSASARLFGVLVRSRPEFVRKGNRGRDIVRLLQTALERGAEFKSGAALGKKPKAGEWEEAYFCLLCFENICKELPALAAKHPDVWVLVVKFMVHDHPWVQQVSSRVVHALIIELDPETLGPGGSAPPTFLSQRRGALFEVVRNTCYQINLDDDQFNEELAATGTKTLAWCVRAMDRHAHLCFADGTGPIVDAVDGRAQGKPVRWLYSRLSSMAKERGQRRRGAVFRTFAAFVATSDIGLVRPYLDVVITPVYRAISEAEHAAGGRGQDDDSCPADVGRDLLALLEERCGTEAYIGAYAGVRARFQERRDKRKTDLAVEMINDPGAAALRKMRKTSREKDRKKRQRVK